MQQRPDLPPGEPRRPIPPIWQLSAQDVEALESLGRYLTDVSESTLACSLRYWHESAEAERRRQIARAFHEQAKRFWPVLAEAATCIEEANAIWRQYLEQKAAEWFRCFPTDALTVDELAFTPSPKTHQRAGITKNKHRGQSKTRRRMAAQSRRRNRRTGA